MPYLTNEQIEVVVNWMKTWEQLKGSSIPIRFKEDFKKKADYYASLKLLHEMIDECNLANSLHSDEQLTQKYHNEIDALRFVIELIKERQTN